MSHTRNPRYVLLGIAFALLILISDSHPQTLPEPELEVPLYDLTGNWIAVAPVVCDAASRNPNVDWVRLAEVLAITEQGILDTAAESFLQAGNNLYGGNSLIGNAALLSANEIYASDTLGSGGVTLFIEWFATALDSGRIAVTTVTVGRTTIWTCFYNLIREGEESKYTCR